MHAEAHRTRSFYWLGAAAVLGFLVPAVFSWGLRWPRSAFLVPYLLVAGTFVLLYLRAHPVPARDWTAHAPEAIGAIVIAVFLLRRNLLGQTASAVPEGLGLLAALAWPGLVYGALDALLLNVLPVLAVGGPPQHVAGPARRRWMQALVGLLASLAVTVAYHAGYPEFHGEGMLYVVIGNAIITSTYLASGNPLAAVVTHVAMHLMAVLHGMETTLQLPPHYGG
jgi:hypothetical protein